MRKILCDRCGADITDLHPMEVTIYASEVELTKKSITVRAMEPPKKSYFKSVELCDDCYRQLMENFLSVTAEVSNGQSSND